MPLKSINSNPLYHWFSTCYGDFYIGFIYILYKANMVLKHFILYIVINNNKFNLPPVPVPLMGLCRLIPFIGKTLFKRKPNHKPRWRDNSILILGRWWLAFYLAKSLYIKPTDRASRTISQYPFFLCLFTLIFTSPLSFKMASIYLCPLHPLPL